MTLTHPAALHAAVPGLVDATDAATSVNEPAAQDQSVDGQLLDLLVAHYYRPVDLQRVRGTRLDRLPAVLGDQYTHYLKPAAVAAMARSDAGRYTGVGVLIGAGTFDHGVRRPVLTDITPASPAAVAGLRIGDSLDAVDATPVADLPVAEVLALMRGDSGTAVSLTLRRDGRAFTVRLVRTALTARVVLGRILDVDGRRVGYVRVVEFDERTGEQVRALVARQRREGAQAFLLDLRGNPGGLADEAVSVVSAFVPRGTPVYQQQGLHVTSKTFRTDKSPSGGSAPVDVLVDEQTASSAEIVAGALRDCRASLLVGRRTFGKGVIQRSWPLDSGGSLKITVAEYMTPAGLRVDKVGLVPDLRLTDPALPPEALAPLVAPPAPRRVTTTDDQTCR